MNIKRILNLNKHLEEKSILLLGPRRTGKSFYIEHQIKPDVYINLLSSEEFRKLSFDPSSLKNLISPNDTIIAIDEIQKLPVLMDEVHSLIEKNKKLRFVLTGSSAKNLKRTHTSLMAGRVRQIHFLPLVFMEVENINFDLKKMLLYGGLPAVYSSKNPKEELKDYAGSYLREEIQASAFVRKIENYSRFLEFSAQTSGQILNFESLANDAFIPARTIKDYYNLLEETLIGYTVRPYKKTGSRKEVSTSKFYFFDLGVLNSLVKRKSIADRSKEFGDLFEHFIFLELKAYQLYQRSDWPINFWRTQTGHEVDFVLGDGEVAIEIKSSSKIQSSDCNGLSAFAKDYSPRRQIIVSQSKEKNTIGNVEIYPWVDFLKELWNGHIIKD
jgi:predicted AAA+ superfamily ATPase